MSSDSASADTDDEPVVARTRVVVGAVSGIAVGVGSIFVAPWQFAILAGWDTAAAVFLIWMWSTIHPMSGDRTMEFAIREDPSRALSDVMLIVASLSCLVGVAFTLIKAADASGNGKAGLVAIAVLSVIVSWTVVHTVFTLRYAGLYYTAPAGGVDFNTDTSNGEASELPDYVDFAYLAFTVGMTYQVSDTDITDRSIRRTALKHGLLSFLFGTFIVAMLINVIAGLLK